MELTTFEHIELYGEDLLREQYESRQEAGGNPRPSLPEGFEFPGPDPQFSGAQRALLRCMERERAAMQRTNIFGAANRIPPFARSPMSDESLKREHPAAGVPAVAIVERILAIRGHRVMLDEDLAELYGVETKSLVRAVQRNIDRFPGDFMLRLTQEEFAALRYQFGTSNMGRGGRRYRPYAFTEQGVAMLSGVLRSKRAVAVNIQIMRAFVELRRMAASHAALERRLDELEREIGAKFGEHDKHLPTIFQTLRRLVAPPEKPKRRIGFAPPEETSTHATREGRAMGLRASRRPEEVAGAQASLYSRDAFTSSAAMPREVRRVRRCTSTPREAIAGGGSRTRRPGGHWSTAGLPAMRTPRHGLAWPPTGGGSSRSRAGPSRGSRSRGWWRCLGWGEGGGDVVAT